jgi:hypothetical protein
MKEIREEMRRNEMIEMRREEMRRDERDKR